MLLRAALVLCALVAWSGPARAVAVRLAVDEAQSGLTPDGGATDPLRGALRFRVGELPLGGSATPLDVEQLDLQSDSGFMITLDDSLANPGAGVLRSDATFEIPTLFVTVDDGAATFDLGINDVTGTVLFGLGGASILELSTDFSIETGGGLVAVTLVAVPEPASAGLLALGVLALASGGARRRGPR